jgi:serine/threonine protein kinase/peptidoglycan/xylan/chitin deacetylase (PgdA/CDA1 family)
LNQPDGPNGQQTESPGGHHSVFISHSNEDETIADAVCAALEAENISCWIAPRNVQGDRPYSVQIIQAIREAKVLILVLSAASGRSKHVLREVDRAAYCQNPILTFRVEPVNPRDDLDYFLGADHWVDGFQPLPPSQHFPKLIRYARELIEASEVASGDEAQSNTLVAEMFAHYRILRHLDGSRFELGKGGMGVTYKAFDTSLNRPVALKVIGADLLRSPQARRRFQREAQAAALINHPHVATIYHFGEEGGDYFYAMEFVEGENLESYVARLGPLSVATALRVVLQVAQALEAAQARRLIHRDIKPANLMAVVNRTGTLDVKLIDFGLAKGAGAESLDPSRVTRTQDFVGSPAFASPEQCDVKKLDIRSDIYSLGVTLWYLLTGETPFTGSVREVMNAQVEKPSPFEQLTQVPDPVVALMRRMLEKKPEDRFQTPEELQEAVQQAASQLSTQFAVVPERISLKPNAEANTPSSANEPDALIAVAPDSSFDAYLAVQTGAILGGRYRLLGEEREGNCGRLFHAGDERTPSAQPSDVAVKLLHPRFAADPALLDLLENELEVIRNAAHQHLITYDCLERSAPVPYVVREWVHGFLLYDLLRWRRSVKAPELLALLDPLAVTLDFVVDQGLGLVDVSVRKLMVVCPSDVFEFEPLAKGDAREWGRCTLKLNPLSLAPLLFKSRNGWDLQTIIPASRVLSMTQAEAGIRGTKAVKLYGKLVYELLSGRPVSRENALKYTPLAELNQAGNEILRRACASDDGSYRSCQELWNELKENLAVRPRPSDPVPLPMPIVSPVPHSRQAKAAGLGERHQPTPVVPAGPLSKRSRKLIVVGAALGLLIIGLGIFLMIRSGPGLLHTFYYKTVVPSSSPSPLAIAGSTPGSLASPTPTQGSESKPKVGKTIAPTPGVVTANKSALAKQSPAVNRSAQFMVLDYHRFEDEAKDLIILPSDFRAQMRALKDNGISVISMKDLIAWLKGEKSIPAKSAVITLDDGWNSQYYVAWPILKEFNYPFTLFIYTDNIEKGGKTMTWAQLEEMRDAGVDVEAYTVSHHDLRHAPHGQDYPIWLHNEVYTCKQILEEKLAIKVVAFAFPYGLYNDLVRKTAADAGYELQFTLYGQHMGINAPADQIGRYAVDSIKPAVFKAALDFGGDTGTPGAEETQLAAASMLTEPMDNAHIINPKPTIMANIATMGDVDPTSVEMRISGVGLVPAHYDPRTKLVSYEFTQNLVPKSYTVILSAKASGKKVETRWVFTLD